MHYLSYHDGSEVVLIQEDTLTDGIAVTVAENERLYRSTRYTWSFWDYEKIQNDPPIERKKQSFHYLKRELPRFNSPPIGVADTFEVFPGSSLDIAVEEGLLANDFDIDGNEISAALSFGNSPEQGTLQLHPNGSFLYFPTEGFRGNDLFTYYLHDGYTYSTLIPVTIRVGYPLGYEMDRTGGTDNRFTIYPNPGRGLIYIDASQSFSNASVMVTDITGREMAHILLKNSSSRIDMGKAEPGIYIFSITFDHQKEVHRVIVQ
jgi:hypothetical protein